MNKKTVAVAILSVVVAASVGRLAATAVSAVKQTVGSLTISQDGFKKAYASANALVIDVRDETSYRVGHITGAINIPVRQIELRAGLVKSEAQGRTVVTYCACPSEHASAQAAELLVKRGVKNVYALVGGYRAWVKAGGRVSVGTGR